MKSVREIISHLKNDPLFHKLRDRHDFLNLFDKKDKDLISFLYIKDGILFIALKHPIGLLELKRDSNINLIKELLNVFLIARPNSEFAEVCDIKFFVADKVQKRREKLTLNSPEIPPFIEPSEGKFINKCKDPELFKIFEEIREKILANRRD